MKSDFSGLMAWITRPQTLAKANRLSRILAILLGLLAVLSASLLIAFIWPMLAGKSSTYLFFLLDEFDDVLEGILLMAGGAILFAFISRFLKKKSEQTVDMAADIDRG